MNDLELRIEALAAGVALAKGAKDLTEVANAAYTFLTAGNASAATSKPATETAKTVKADAQKTEPAAQEPSSDKPADGKPTKTATSPSDASGFAEDGAEITVAEVRAAAVKFVAAQDEPALVAALGEFGADKLSALEAKDYAAFVEKLSVPVADAGVFD